MFAFLRNRIVWVVIVVVAVLGAGGLFMTNQANAKKAAAAKVATANAPKSPYVAIANGKADVEGGIINVAARRAGVVKAVYVEEGQKGKKDQLLGKLQEHLHVGQDVIIHHDPAVARRLHRFA